MSLDPMKVQAVLLDLGVRPADLEQIRRLPFAAAHAKLNELKETVRKNYKRLVFELHPDRTGNDPAKTERFKMVCTVKDEFEKLQVRPPAPVMPPPTRVVAVQQPLVVHVVTWSSAGSTYTASTVGVRVPVGVPFRVATMKPT